MNAHSVFVYGTLRRGGSNHFRMSGAEFVGDATVRGVIYVIDENPELIFPALVDDAERRVMGEVYRLSDELLKALDAFEGVSESNHQADEYRRVEVAVEFTSGFTDVAWVWKWNRSLGDAVLVESGDWLEVEPNPS